MAPSPRPVGVKEPRPNTGKTARPTIVIDRRVSLAVTMTVSPTFVWVARSVEAPRTISSGARDGRPATIVGNTACLNGWIPTAGTRRPPIDTVSFAPYVPADSAAIDGSAEICLIAD